VGALLGQPPQAHPVRRRCVVRTCPVVIGHGTIVARRSVTPVPGRTRVRDRIAAPATPRPAMRARTVTRSTRHYEGEPGSLRSVTP
jgi:hypothetical protein